MVYQSDKNINRIGISCCDSHRVHRHSDAAVEGARHPASDDGFQPGLASHLRPARKGSVLATKAVEPRGKRRCLGHDGSGTTRRRRCLTPVADCVPGTRHFRLPVAVPAVDMAAPVRSCGPGLRSAAASAG